MLSLTPTQYAQLVNELKTSLVENPSSILNQIDCTIIGEEHKWLSDDEVFLLSILLSSPKFSIPEDEIEFHCIIKWLGQNFEEKYTGLKASLLQKNIIQENNGIIHFISNQSVDELNLPKTHLPNLDAINVTPQPSPILSEPSQQLAEISSHLSMIATAYSKESPVSTKNVINMLLNLLPPIEAKRLGDKLPATIGKIENDSPPSDKQDNNQEAKRDLRNERNRIAAQISRNRKSFCDTQLLPSLLLFFSQQIANISQSIPSLAMSNPLNGRENPNTRMPSSSTTPQIPSPLLQQTIFNHNSPAPQENNTLSDIFSNSTSHPVNQKTNNRRYHPY